ncbi:GTPase [Nonomuraea cavernae]|uniref:GTPase n=1 Tax=Nonomuraea cavernae TaxID=2045107 RepID=UPI00340B2412
MKLLRRKEGPSLDSRLAALLEAAELGEGRLPEEAVSGARAVAERAGVRRDLSVAHTVVALAGATGSGKSSLFNALAGEQVAVVGVTRPTTSAAQAALWDGSGAGPLLDWLDIFERHTAAPSPADAGDLSGLILLDLPDHDSIQLSHRLEVDRLVELVDLLVWVVDPQKYADAALHERYLRPLARHRDVMVVVLNQIDRLPPAAVQRCLDDLRRLLDEDGLSGVPVLGASARTGAGVDRLHALLDERVSEHLSWAARVSADVSTAADLLTDAATHRPGPGTPVEPEATPGTPAEPGARPSTPAEPGARPSTPAEPGARPDAKPGSLAGHGPGTLAVGRDIAVSGVPAALPAVSGGASTGRGLTKALSEAAGVPLVVRAVAKGHRHRAVVATGWPVTRWLRRFRPDPLRRLRIGTGASGRGGDPEIVGRTSVPAASTVQKAQVDSAVRDVSDAAAAGLPERWAAAVRRAARSRSAELADAVDRAVATTSLRATRRPRWWTAVGVLQWLVFATMAVGGLWLGVLFAMDYLRLPQPPLPTVGEVPWPTVLLAGGALAGVLIALLSRLAAWAGGRRRARRTAKALRAAIDEVSGAYVLRPVEEELARYTRFRDAVTLARA